MRKNKAVVVNVGSNPDNSPDLLHIRDTFPELGQVDSRTFRCRITFDTGKIASPKLSNLDLVHLIDIDQAPETCSDRSSTVDTLKIFVLS